MQGERRHLESIRSTMIGFVLFVLFLVLFVSWGNNLVLIKAGVSNTLTREAKDIRITLNYLKKMYGDGATQEYVRHITETGPGITLLIYYDRKKDVVSFSSDSTLNGMSLRELSKRDAGKNIAYALKEDADHEGVFDHQKEIDVTLIDNNSVLMMHFLAKEFIDKPETFSFWLEVIETVVLALLVTLPFIYFVRRLLIPVQEDFERLLQNSDLSMGKLKEVHIKKRNGLFLKGLLESFELTYLASIQQQEWFMKTIEQLPQGIMFGDTSGSVVYSNECLLEILGLSPDETKGSRWLGVVHADDRQKVAEKWDATLKEVTESTVDFRFFNQYGWQNWVKGTFKPVRNLENQIIGTVACFETINQQVKLQQDIKKESGHVIDVLTASNIGVWDWDMATNTVAYSHIWKAMLGYEDSEISNSFEEWRKLIHPEDLPLAEKEVQESLMKGQLYNLQVRLRQKNGEYKWIQTYGTLTEYNADGTPKRATGIHLELEKEGGTTTQNVANLLSNPALIAFRVSPDGTFTEFAGGSETVFGLSVHDANNKKIWEYVSEDEKRSLENVFRETEKGTGREVFTLILKRWNAQEKKVQFAVLSTKDAEGNHCGFSFVGIPETAKSEEIDKLALASQERTDFITIVSHQLRTPLSVIHETIEILDQLSTRDGDPKFKEFINVARNNTNKVIQMIHDTLDYEELEFQTKAWEYKKQNLSALFQELFEEYSFRYKEKGIAFKIEGTEREHNAVVDKEELKKALRNLVTNALFFTEKGEVSLTIREDETFVYMDVKDTGIGIRDEDKENIFKIFAQIHSSNMRFGSGLGLAVVKKIAELHKGDVTFESQFGAGSTFTIKVPKERNDG